MTKKQKLIKENLNILSKKIQLNTNNTVLQKIEMLLNLISSNLKEETIEVCLHLGTDAKKTDQNVKTSFELIHGWSGKKKKIGLFTPNETKIDNPNITVGGLNLIDEIKTTKINKFDICVAHSSFEKQMNSIAKVLQKTSPNKKCGTLTDNCEQVAINIANNNMKLVSNENSMLHTTIGTSKMTSQQLLDNLCKVIEVINNAKPAKLKVSMIKSIFITSTQFPQSIKIMPREISLYTESKKI